MRRSATGSSITLDEGPYPGLTFEIPAPVRLMRRPRRVSVTADASGMVTFPDQLDKQVRGQEYGLGEEGRTKRWIAAIID